MDFPRFTSGNVGALSFAHVNAIFDRIERLESTLSGRPNGGGTSHRGRVILARVLARNAQNAHSWVESQRNSTAGIAYSDVEGGARSTVDQDAYAVPLVGGIFEPGEIVPAFLRSTSSGGMYVESVSSGVVAAYIIVSSTGNGPIWQYTARLARWNTTTLRFVALEGSPTVTLRNGAENPVDTATQVGVGTEFAAGVTMTRKPIKNGTVVTALRMNDGTLVFSLPNGYQVEC